MFNKKSYNFYIYILSNYDRNCLYVGFCNDIARRIIEHTHSFGCEYSKKYKTFDLLYYEHYQYVNEAREKQIKRWGRDKKIALIKTKNPELKKLTKNYSMILDFLKKISLK